MSDQPPPSPPPPPPPTPPSPPITATNKSEDTQNPDESSAPTTSSLATPLPKKPHSRRKKKNPLTRKQKKIPLTPKQTSTAKSKLLTLSQNFRPVPFSPAKTLDFSAREPLFRALGLWDFAHLNLDPHVRSEPLAHLIAYYDPANRRSYVFGARISVGRSDLARALTLPTKKEKGCDLECADEDVAALLEFISNYMPYGDDMCILPPEIMQATQLVRDREFQKVDWAALMWVLVEKELLEADRSGVCHCASHLQRLIMHQQPQLFDRKEEAVLETVVEGREEEVLAAEDRDDAAGNEGDDYDDFGEVKVARLEDLGDLVGEKEDGELGLRLGGEENVMGGFEEGKVGGDEEWIEEGENEGFEHCFRRCNSRDVVDMDFENLAKHEQGSQEMGYPDDLSTKFSNLGRISSSDLLHAMANSSNMSIPYDHQFNAFNVAPGEFLTMGAESNKDVLGHGTNGSMYAGNNGKRQAVVMGVAEDDAFEHNLQKRMRSAEPWGDLQMSFDECMGYMQTGLERAKLLFAEKEKKMESVQMQIPYLNEMLQEKDQTIRSLRSMIEEQQHWRMVVRHYEHELCLMTQMLLGYKKALKETRISFSEYKNKSSKDDEALYKDVPGSGGLVLSAREFEKYQLEKEEKERRELLGTFDNLEKVLMKFNKYEERIMMYNVKLVDLTGEVKQLKERFIKSNSSSV